MATNNAPVLMSVSILAALAESLVGGQTSVRTKPRTPDGNRLFALGTSQLGRFRHSDSCWCRKSKGHSRPSQPREVPFCSKSCTSSKQDFGSLATGLGH